MKKFFGLKSLVTGFAILGAIVLSHVTARAQSSSGQITATSLSVDWKTESEAMVILESTCIDLGSQLEALAPGTQPYHDMLNRLSYHRHTYNKLEEGESVVNAVLYALDAVTGSSTSDPSTDFDAIPQLVLQNFFNESVALLAN